MKRSPSYSAQASFNIVSRLQFWSSCSNPVIRLSARLAIRIAKPISKTLGAKHTVIAHVYGRSLIMPAEHPLPLTLQLFPQFNRPLALAIATIAAANARNSELAVIDVGANIGDTIAIAEQHVPNICQYLCIEADRDLAELCKLNHKDNDRARIEQCFIGESEGSLVRLEDDGRANPSTKSVTESSNIGDLNYGRLVRLDTAAESFATDHGRLDLIKVDTEGYDFSVLRSGPRLLKRYKPAVYFEWFPRLLLGLNEEIWDGFEYLANLGYCHFVFFTNRGDYYCKISNPDHLFLESVASITLGNNNLQYFDIFGSTSELICDELVRASITKQY